MRCSNCSGSVKPIVAVDIDGTLGDYHSHFIDFAMGYFDRGRPEEVFDGSVRFRDFLRSHWGIDERDWHEVKLAYRQGGMKRTMPTYPGAAEMCQDIRGCGAELWITTTRPYHRLDNIDPDTRFWMKRNGIRPDGLLFDQDKYRTLAERVDPPRVVAVVDDLPKMYDAAAEAFGEGIPILRKQQFNRGVSRKYESEDLEQIRRAVRVQIGLWDLKNGDN